MGVEGTVQDLNASRGIGKTADMEARFLAAVRACVARGPHYVVVGEGHDEFAARLEQLDVPVVRDPSIGESALILAGPPRRVARPRSRINPGGEMAKRSEHTFQFSARQIADAAQAEAEYHEGRIEHWQAREAAALEIVKGSIGAKVVEQEMTNGKQVSVVVDYGDPEAWKEYQLAHGKVGTHRSAAERFRTDERLYRTQHPEGTLIVGQDAESATYASAGGTVYDLDVDDVHHFRLGGQPRED